MKFRIVLTMLIATCAMLLGCAGHVSTYRFRLHVEVDTPEGQKFGSSVIEVSWWTNHFVPGFGKRGDGSITGDAVFVDLGRGKSLVAILGLGSTGNERAFHEMPWRAFGHKPVREEFWQIMETQTGSVDLLLDNIPTLVTFHDIANPASVEVVGPLELPSAFGAGYSIGRVWIETTRDPILQTLDQQLPWLLSLIEKERKKPFFENRGGFYMRTALFRRSST